ncbi:hypothetical protein C0J50_8674 [Silurus asotus]|uniref:Endonuclease/exonuclease/phosphatase domain-containing protein n=1 Tax=Silurus asotus TaxID=30991 RepID=A0AAD5FHC4_SILAS|nr:hypothetical protein C0J50_8674 [Silurus asotus]
MRSTNHGLPSHRTPRSSTIKTKWKGSKERNIGGGFKVFFHGVEGKRNCVVVILSLVRVPRKNVMEVKRVFDEVMNVKLKVKKVMINVISAYASHVGCEMEEKEKFLNELDEVVEGVPRNEQLVIGADFNGHGNYCRSDKGDSEKILGVTIGNRKEDKETWWWNEEAQESITRKRLAKQNWNQKNGEKSRQEYKEMQQQVKMDVATAKEKAYEKLYVELYTEEGETDLNQLARQRE